MSIQQRTIQAAKNAIDAALAFIERQGVTEGSLQQATIQAANNTIEAAVVLLATGVTERGKPLAAVSHAAYVSGPTGNNKQFELDRALGDVQLCRAIVLRMRALGLQCVLDQANWPGTIGAEWLEAENAKIARLVP